jgi:cell division protein FtsA
MELKEKIVAAIDIGTTKIVAIIGMKDENGKIDILGYGNTMSTGVKRGVVLNIEQTVNAIKKAVKKAETQAGLKITDAYVGIAGQHIRSMRNHGYINRDSYDVEISKEDIEALVADVHKIPIDIGEEIIHVLPQNFIVDNEVGVKNPVGMFGKRLEANFHIVIGQTAAANNIKKCVNRAGINVKKLILEPLASSDAVLTEDEKEIGVALVDIGGGTTDVAIFYEGIIQHTAVIPFGGNIVTQDIKQGCNILERYAEQLKIKYGSSLADKTQENKVVSIPGISGRPPKEISFKNLAHIIQSRMEEIISQVNFELGASGILPQIGAGIVLTGGGALVKNLSQLVSYKTGMEVRLGLPNQNVQSKIINEVNQPTFATGIGLMLAGFEDKDDKSCVTNGVIEEQDVKTEEQSENKDTVLDVNTKPTEKKTKRKFSFSTFVNAKKNLENFFDVDDEKM